MRAAKDDRRACNPSFATRANTRSFDTAGLLQRKWPLAGPFLCQPSVHVMTVLDDHHPVGMAMTPAFVPAVIAMFAEFGAGAEW